MVTVKNFEDTVATLLPADPVSKKQVKCSKYVAEISSMHFEQDEATVDSTGTMKSGKGSFTGANLRFHTSAEYTYLTHPQRHKLKTWRINPAGSATVKASKTQRTGNNTNSSPRKQTGEEGKLIAAAVEMALAKKAMAEQLMSKESTKAKAFVISVINKLTGKTSATTGTTTANSVDIYIFLTSTLKKAKNA